MRYEYITLTQSLWDTTLILTLSVHQTFWCWNHHILSLKLYILWYHNITSMYIQSLTQVGRYLSSLDWLYTQAICIIRDGCQRWDRKCSLFPNTLLGVHDVTHSLYIHYWMCQFLDYVFGLMTGFFAWISLTALDWDLFFDTLVASVHSHCI